MKYNRILIKLSGEVLSIDNHVISDDKLMYYTNEIQKVYNEGVKIALIIGGGNIYRGIQKNSLITRTDADYMGMLATIINSIALKNSLQKKSIKTKLFSAVEINKICDFYNHNKAIEHYNNGEVIIIAGGTGNPFFTTDTTAALRSIELNSQIMIKATKVDAVYDKDPFKYNDAKKFEKLTYDIAISNQLNIMDITAFTLCKENKLPISVININKPDELYKLIKGEKVGTIISN